MTEPDLEIQNRFIRRALQARALAAMEIEVEGTGLNASSSAEFASIRAKVAPATPESPIKHGLEVYPRVAGASNGTSTQFCNTTSSAALVAAREIVKKARAEAAKRNAARVAKPLRNRYLYGRGSGIKGQHNALAALNDATPPPPLLVITDKITAAAALVAEADLKPNANITRQASKAGKGTFWIQDIARKGSVP